MRTAFLAIVVALAACCATADQIDNVVTNLPNGWDGGSSDLIITPQTAATEDLLKMFLGNYCFYTSDYTNYIQITNFTILKTRQVDIPAGRFPGAHVYSYTAVHIQARQGVQVVMLLRYFDVYTSRAWLGEAFEVEPRPMSPEPNTAVAVPAASRRWLGFLR